MEPRDAPRGSSPKEGVESLSRGGIDLIKCIVAESARDPPSVGTGIRHLWCDGRINVLASFDQVFIQVKVGLCTSVICAEWSSSSVDISFNFVDDAVGHAVDSDITGTTRVLRPKLPSEGVIAVVGDEVDSESVRGNPSEIAAQ